MTSAPLVASEAAGVFTIAPLSAAVFANGLTVAEQTSVSNPAVGNSTIFVNNSGQLSTTDGLGNTAAYLGSPALANQNMAGFALANVGSESFQGDVAITKATNSSNVAIGGSVGAGSLSSICIGGFGNSVSGSNNISIGSQNLVNGSGQYQIAIGESIHTTSGGAVSVCIGGGNTGITNPQQNSVAIGNDMTLGAGGSSICLGSQAGIGAVSNAIAIGTLAVNSTASSCLLGDPAIANIRSNNLSFACDLGTSAAPFKTCWLKNASPATSCPYSQYTDVTLTNSAVETSLLTGSAVGGLAFSAPQQLGSVFRFRAVFSISVAVADTITLRFYVNGVLAAASGAIGGGVLANVPGMLLTEFAVRSATLASTINASVNGGASPLITYAAPAFNPGIANTFTLTGQWSAAAAGDSFTLHNIYCENIYST